MIIVIEGKSIAQNRVFGYFFFLQRVVAIYDLESINFHAYERENRASIRQASHPRDNAN